MGKKDKQRHTEIGASLIRTLSDKGLSEILIKHGELAVDAFLKDGILKDVPVIGTLTKLWQAGVGVKEYLLVRKLQRFLGELEDVAQEELNAFQDEIGQDKEFRERVGESLLLILEKNDEIDKPELIGRAFRAYLKGTISYSQFTDVSHAINRGRIKAINMLKKEHGAYDGDWWAEELLHSGTGLMQQHHSVVSHPHVRKPHESKPIAEIGYTVSELGYLLKMVCWDNKNAFYVGCVRAVRSNVFPILENFRNQLNEHGRDSELKIEESALKETFGYSLVDENFEGTRTLFTIDIFWGTNTLGHMCFNVNTVNMSVEHLYEYDDTQKMRKYPLHEIKNYKAIQQKIYDVFVEVVF